MQKTTAPLLLLALAACNGQPRQPATDSRFVCYVVNPAAQPLRLYYQDEQHRRFGSLGQLRAWLGRRGQRLLFAMNGGMYRPGGAPQGLYVAQQHVLAPLDTGRGAGNFYLQPNGVLYLDTQRQAGICPTSQFPPKAGSVAYATQSGPLLLQQGRLNPAFTRGSGNVQLRNGVGLLPGNRLAFVYAAEKVNLYDFATYFQRLGCRSALYLDGYVSRLYLPAQGWQQTDGDFGVIIGVAVPTTAAPAPRPR